LRTKSIWIDLPQVSEEKKDNNNASRRRECEPRRHYCHQRITSKTSTLGNSVQESSIHCNRTALAGRITALPFKQLRSLTALEVADRIDAASKQNKNESLANGLFIAIALALLRVLVGIFQLRKVIHVICWETATTTATGSAFILSTRVWLVAKLCGVWFLNGALNLIKNLKKEERSISLINKH
jgi:hypothetical protein